MSKKEKKAGQRKADKALVEAMTSALLVRTEEQQLPGKARSLSSFSRVLPSMDVDRIVGNSRITSDIGTGSLGQSVGGPTPADFHPVCL